MLKGFTEFERSLLSITEYVKSDYFFSMKE
jgi:hypothetical protein